MKSEVIPWKIKIASGKFSNIFSHYANGESLAPARLSSRLGTRDRYYPSTFISPQKKIPTTFQVNIHLSFVRCFVFFFLQSVILVERIMSERVSRVVFVWIVKSYFQNTKKFKISNGLMWKIRFYKNGFDFEYSLIRFFVFSDSVYL